ncbi:MAG: 1-(5-phosphoribosyl)-5-[(5-phosphoribosylamino)methylideneamino]imidazole-4-carboxamide isomerase [Aestuariivita sp.]|nr:1-(5-phosphoribosyl)-5-[(5-phosphoribosylamino)methylideneamino]imidazole-4-carboxamide isomerase [Aestuariivita sp.]
MILYPAIDLKDNQVVRLLRGNMDKTTVFNVNPADQAKKFADNGCSWLHLVDLNGAFAGKPINTTSVEQILNSVNIPTQLGGGIRSLETIEYWLNRGITRVILGTIAVENPEIVCKAARLYPDQIVVGIDAIDGKVATRGWVNETNFNPIEIASFFEDAGVAAIIFTDIYRDGAMQGPNIDATIQLAKAVSIPVIASGGITSLKDLISLRNAGIISGVISGRALYDGTLELTQALEVLRSSANMTSHSID